MEHPDSFSEVTNQSWFSRLGQSIKNVIGGLILFVLAFVVLWFNEGRAVKTAKGLNEGAAQVQSVDHSTINPANNGKLVHLSGTLTTEEYLADETFGLSVQGLKLRRSVEMYQWEEKKESKKEKKLGGGEKTVTTYNYQKGWNRRLISSGDFKKPAGHTNPAQMPYEGYNKQVDRATVGAFTISPSLLGKVSNYEPHSLEALNTRNILGAQLTQENSTLFIGKGSPSNPEVGDVRIRFEWVKPGDYSIVAQQNNESFEAFKTSTGTSIELIETGPVSAEGMFEAAQSRNTVLTWVLRLVGFLMMFFGLNTFFKPLVVVADVVPLVGNLLDMGLGLFSGVIAFSLSFLTIAFAWIFYRPLLGIALLAIGAGTFYYFYQRSAKRKEAKHVAGVK